MDGFSLAAEARGYAKSARKKEEVGKKEEARKLYLKAAKSFLEASKNTAVMDDKQLRKQLAQTFYGKAISLRTSYMKKEKNSDSSKNVVDGENMFLLEKPNLNFSDVGGLIDVKEEIKKAIVYPFEKPELYKMYGKKAGEGILLYGPPGCGKTFIARAAAGECNTSFLNIKISTILSKWLGDSEKNVQLAFDTAGKNAPSILFFDEIDALGGVRSGTTSVYAKRVVNTLLTAIDGLEGPQEKVLTLAATNEPWAVDPALRRPGRFSKLLLIPPPDYEARIEIFKLNMKERPHEESIDFSKLAKSTDGYSSADISQICIEAADIPLEKALKGATPQKISMQDFESVLQKRTSSLISWFKVAEKNIKKYGEEQEFDDLVKYIKKYS